MATFTKIYHSTPYATISPTRPENSASGRTVMVTGSTEGIGLAVLRAFVSAGADRVIVLSRRESALAAAREELGAVAASVAGEGKTKVEGRTVDLADGDSINALWDALKADGVAVDVLVTNAALTATGSLADDPTACWSSFEINVLANLRMVKRFLAQGEGRSKALLNISSFMAHSNPAPGQGAYAASKAGFASALQHMAEDLDATKVQVVSIHPGAVLTAAAKRHGHTEASLPWDDENLPGHFCVWAATPAARFLHGRLVWANWDADELMARKEEIGDTTGMLQIGLQGCEFVDIRTIFPKILEHQKQA